MRLAILLCSCNSWSLLRNPAGTRLDLNRGVRNPQKERAGAVM